MRGRRGLGVSAVQNRERREGAYQKVGEESKSVQLSHMKEVIEKFKRDLEEFAAQHRNRIIEDPLFRYKFHQMCTKIGVDPLVSSKSFWSDLFGFGDYYYHLAIKISRIALATRTSNGGLMSLSELIEKLKATSNTGKLDNISEDDVRRAISSLSVLGNNFRVVEIAGNKPFLVSNSLHFNNDHESVLSLSQDKGYFNVEMCKNELGWGVERFNLVTESLLKEGVVWLDIHEGQWNLYIPAQMCS